MILKRVLTGAVVAAVTALVIAYSHIPLVLNSAIAFLCIKGICELYRATGVRNNTYVTSISCALALLISLIHLPGDYRFITALFLIAAAIFVYLMAGVKSIQKINAVLSVIIAFIITFFFKSMSDIRAMENGVCLLILAVLVGYATDISAFFVGRRLGKHKLAPVISPNKTIEGAVGGTLIAAIILVIVSAILDWQGIVSISYGRLLIYLVSASLVGQFGDLAMSSIKRITGIKDYGNLMPGHGGVLDRFDSLLFILPFTYLFCYDAKPLLML